MYTWQGNTDEHFALAPDTLGAQRATTGPGILENLANAASHAKELANTGPRHTPQPPWAGLALMALTSRGRAAARPDRTPTTLPDIA